MQLFSIGLLQLHPDGTPRLEGGAPVETYTNADVQGARPGLHRLGPGWPRNRRGIPPPVPMKLDPTLHSMAEKRFLGVVIPAGTGGPQSLALAMDAISAHPNVGPFIGAQLIQRLVASNPSPAYVARVAAVFADDGLGARGNLKAVTRAVLLDPEARFPDLASPHWGKVREPILRFSGWARPSARARAMAPGPCPTPATTPSGWRKARCARPACSTSSVRYTPAATELARQGLAAPELQITDETSIAGYLNFLAIYADRGWEDLQTDYAAELALAGDPDALVAHVALLLAGDAFSEATARRIATALRDIPPERSRDRVRAAIVLVAASPEYLVQK
ncbi:DUF1800 family protein [Achromobacter xylosoxidans]